MQLKFFIFTVVVILLSVDFVGLAGDGRQPALGPVPALCNIKALVIVLDPQPFMMPDVVRVAFPGAAVSFDFDVVPHDGLTITVEILGLVEADRAGLGLILHAVIGEVRELLRHDLLRPLVLGAGDHVFGILLVEIDPAADLLADAVFGIALDGAALRGLESGTDGIVANLRAGLACVFCACLAVKIFKGRS